MTDRWMEEAHKLSAGLKAFPPSDIAALVKDISVALSSAQEAGKAEVMEAIGKAGYLFGDQAPTENEKTVLQRSAGIPHLPTNLTYECRLALSGEGPRAYTWSDKPHRIVFDLCRVIEEAAAIRSREVKP